MKLDLGRVRVQCRRCKIIRESAFAFELHLTKADEIRDERSNDDKPEQ